MRRRLHVHTRHSGMCTVPAPWNLCRESDNEPSEVTRKLPAGELPVGAYGNTEPDRSGLQSRWNDFESFLVSLEERDLFYTANHVFSSLPGGHMVKNNPWTQAATMLEGLAVRIATLGNYVVESVFARSWTSRYLKARASRVANAASRPVAEAA